MTKAEKFNLYADTLYGMCRKAQDTVPEVKYRLIISHLPVFDK